MPLRSLPLPDLADAAVVDAQFHPTRPWVLVAFASGQVVVRSTSSGVVMHDFEVDVNSNGPLKAARFFDSSTLVHVSLLPAALVGEARANLILAVCGKSIVVYDCVTKLATTYAPPVLATGGGPHKASGVLSGAIVGISCEHVIVGTTFGSMFTVSVQTGALSAFSGTTKLHDKSIVSIVAVTGRPSPQLHRARIASACAGGIVAIWEVPCESPIYKVGPRVLVQNPSTPVIDMRFDVSRNRLACCFGNASASVWAFEEQSQEETVISTISKGFVGGQIGLPRGVWTCPDDSLLMVTPHNGLLVNVLPSSSASKLARQLQKGLVNLSYWDNKSLSNQPSEHLVPIRIVVDLAACKSEGGEGKKIVRFWQHPLSPGEYLFLAQDAQQHRSLLFIYESESIRPPTLHHDGPVTHRILAMSESRLIAKQGPRFQVEKTIAAVSPYLSMETLPTHVLAWAGEPKPEILAGLDLESPIETLWPGPMNMATLERDGIALVGCWWKEAARYLIASYKQVSPGSADSPQASLNVVQSGEGRALAFAVWEKECLAIVSREEDVQTGGSSTAITDQSKNKPALLRLSSSFKSRSFRGATTSSASFKGVSSTKEAKSGVTHYYVSIHKVGANPNSSASALVEVQLNQPITDIVSDIGGDLVLMRGDLPDALSNSSLLKPWSRFYKLSSLIREKKLAHVGPALPAHRLVTKWEHKLAGTGKRCVSFALCFDQVFDRISILDAVDGHVRHRCSVFTSSSTPCISLKWHLGSLFFATDDTVQVAFVGCSLSTKMDDCPTYMIATRERSSAAAATSPSTSQHQTRRDSLHVHDDQTRPEDAPFAPSPAFVRAWDENDTDETSVFPIPVARPFLTWIYILGVEKEAGDLIVLSSGGKVSPIPLRHPLLRVGMLAAAGLGKSGLKWATSLPQIREARDEAVLLLNRLGFHHEAALVPRATPRLLLDVCLKYRCTAAALKTFGVRSVAFGELAQESRDDSADGLTAYERLALLLASEGKGDVIESFVRKLPTDREKQFCSALVQAAALNRVRRPSSSVM